MNLKAYNILKKGKSITAIPKVATPVISIIEGVVTITTATEGATIYYTTDGSEPTVESEVYVDTFRQYSSTTIKAIAVKSGMISSEIASESYTNPAFVLKVKTDNEGESNDDQFRVTKFMFGQSNFDIKTSDGQTFTDVGTTTITFPQAGEYFIELFGFTHMGVAVTGEAKKVIGLYNWGTTPIPDSAGVTGFNYCENMRYYAYDSPVPASSKSVSGYALFQGCSSLIGNESMKLWDIRNNFNNVASMFVMTAFNIDVSNWDLREHTYLKSFFGGSNLNFDMGGLRLSTATTDMTYMLANSNMSVKNYSRTLIGWANYVYGTDGGAKEQHLPANVNASDQTGCQYNDTAYYIGLQFNDAVSARAYLTTAIESGGAGWTITDGGQV